MQFLDNSQIAKLSSSQTFLVVWYIHLVLMVPLLSCGELLLVGAGDTGAYMYYRILCVLLKLPTMSVSFCTWL